MGHDANTTVGGRWRALDELITELEDAHRAVAEAQAREARLFAAALDLALERAAEQHAAGLRRRSHADLPLREVAAEIGAALRLSDRAVQRRMGDASTTVTDYPDVLTSWEHGTIDAAHVAAILDAGTGINPELRARYETRVLAAAETETAGRMKSIARIIAARVDPEAAARRQRAAKADRNIRVIDLPDDMARLIADLPATLTYAIYDRLTRMAQGVPDAPATAAPDHSLADCPWPDAETDPSVDDLRNESLVRVTTGPSGDAGSNEHHDIKTAERPVDTRTMDQRRADLLADMLLAGAPVAHGAGLDTIRGEVQVTIPVLTLAGVGSQPALLAGYGPVDADTARRLAANAPGWDRVMTDPTPAPSSASTDTERTKTSNGTSAPETNDAAAPDASDSPEEPMSTTPWTPPAEAPPNTPTSPTSADDTTPSNTKPHGTSNSSPAASSNGPDPPAAPTATDHQESSHSYPTEPSLPCWTRTHRSDSLPRRMTHDA